MIEKCMDYTNMAPQIIPLKLPDGKEAGQGAKDFGWSAALLLMMMLDE